MSAFEQAVASIFVAPEYYDSFIIGYGFAMTILVVVEFLWLLLVIGLDILVPWLRRKLKLNECKDGEKKC